MALHASHQGRRPCGTLALKNSGLCMYDVRHRVEVRSASKKVDQVWLDVWKAEGPSHKVAEFANQAADALRVAGFTVRVRPVVVV